MSAEVVAQCKTIVIRREEEERRNRHVFIISVNWGSQTSNEKSTSESELDVLE